MDLVQGPVTCCLRAFSAGHMHNINNINFYIARTPEIQINALHNRICIQNIHGILF